jgi:hypothetical protein
MTVLERVGLFVIAMRQPFWVGHGLGCVIAHASTLPSAPPLASNAEWLTNRAASRRTNSQGMNALRQGDFKAAAAAFEQAVAADPHSGALLRNLPLRHRGAGDDVAELAALDPARSTWIGRDVVAWMRKAELHQRGRRNGGAFEAWNAALRPRPSSCVLERADGKRLAGRRFVGDGIQAIRGAGRQPICTARRRSSTKPSSAGRGRSLIGRSASGALTSMNATAFAIRSCRPTNSSTRGISPGSQS